MRSLSFILLLCCIALIAFFVLNKPYILRINPTQSWYIILYKCYQIQLSSTLLKIFASIFIGILAYSHLFLWHLCFLCLVNTGIIEWVGKYSFLLYFLLNFVKIGIKFSVNVRKTHWWSLLGLGFSLWDVFTITVIRVFRFSISSWISFRSLSLIVGLSEWRNMTILIFKEGCHGNTVYVGLSTNNLAPWTSTEEIK